MDMRQMIGAISLIFRETGNMIHDEKDLQKFRDLGKSEEWIKGAHEMYHAIDEMMAPVMKAAMMTYMMETVKAEAEKAKATKETVNKLDETDTKVQTESDITDDVKSLLMRFKGRMQ